MKVHFLGTAAAEGFPAVFCRCQHCRKAREKGGKNIRTRSSVIIDEVIKIDFPADTLHHVLRNDLDLARIEELLITHTHLDHLAATELEMRLPGFAHGIEYPLHIYAHDLPLYHCMQTLGRSGDHFAFHLIQPFKTFHTKHAEVTALPADHDPYETCLLFHIRKDGKALLYGHDTGWFPDETWAWLEGNTVDAAIMDCTNGHIPERRNHLNIEAVIEIGNRFRDTGVFHGSSVMAVTHFSHNTGLSHDDLATIFEPEGIFVAYDGMVLDV